MDVEIAGPPEPLHHGHRAPTTVCHADVTGASAQEAEHRAEEPGDDRAAQIVVPRQLVAQAEWETQDPLHPSAAAALGTPALPHGYIGEYVVNQVGGSLGHPAPAATRAQRPPFAGKRDEPVEAAVVAAKPREPTGQPAAPEKVLEFLLDEAGQPFAVAETGGLRAKGFEMILHDLVEHTLGGTPRLVVGGRQSHAPRWGGRRASG
jgi:hypothetical protein